MIQRDKLAIVTKEGMTIEAGSSYTLDLDRAYLRQEITVTSLWEQ